MKLTTQIQSIEFLGYTSGFSIGCMVFFTIIIVVKWFLGLEKCPLFEDSVANGTMPFENYEQDMTNFNSLRDHYLEPAGASKLLGEFPTGTYVVGNSSSGVHGHITPNCPNQFQLPELLVQYS